MRFELHSNKGSISKNDKACNGEISFPDPVGDTVRYVQPLLSNPLSLLSSALEGSRILEQLSGRVYRLESNHGYIQESIPAVEYYKFACTRIRDNYHAIDICEQRIKSIIQKINEHFSTNKEILPGGRYSIDFEKEIYELRTEVSNFIFLCRAVLDLVSTLFQTVYGPSVGQFASFTSALKAIHKNPTFPDLRLKDRLRNESQWFYLLKDVRDYLAHYGALRFTLREQNGSLRIYAFRDKEIRCMIRYIYHGLSEFLIFLNAHWSEYIVARNN